MKIEFTREQRITNALMLHSSSLSDIGFLHGKMGVALYFSYLARSSGKAVFEDFAMELIDNVTESLHDDIPVDFENGITGIGWAVEHLIQNGFIEADADDVLEELDAKVARELIYSENSFENLLSIGYYYCARLCYRVEDDTSPTVLNLKYNAILFIDELERQIWNNNTHRVETAHLLDELLKLNIFNYKVNEIRKFLNITEFGFIVPFIPRMTSEQLFAKLNSPDVPSPLAGYNLSQVPEMERWGLKNGIAGIGLQSIILQDTAL